MAVSNAPQPLRLAVPGLEAVPPMPLSSSPVELFQTASGLPLLLTLGVLLLHSVCCVLQFSCGASHENDEGSNDRRASKRALHESIALSKGSS